MPHLLEHEIDANDPAFLYLNLHPEEEIKLVIRHHWAGFLGYIGITLALALFPLLLGYALNVALGESLAPYMEALIVAVSGFYLFLLTFLFGAWINFYYDIIFITNERIINVAQEGLLARTVSELSMQQVQNVTAQVQGFLQNFFNYGHLIIETAGEGTSDNPNIPGLQGYFTIRDIPDPNRVARIILELHRAATDNA